MAEYVPLSETERVELHRLQHEFYIASLGDRPYHPNVAKLRRLVELEVRAEREIERTREDARFGSWVASATRTVEQARAMERQTDHPLVLAALVAARVYHQAVLVAVAALAPQG